MTPKDLESIALRVAGVGTVRTAGRVEFVKDPGVLRRDVRVEGFKWDPDIHRNLAKTLWAIDRSHSYGMAALRLFSKMSSSEFSPDGLLGGRGYIQKVKDLRANLGQAVEVLSTFADTMHDEVNADHWRAAMEDGDPSTKDIVSEAATANPEQYVQQSFQEEVPSAEEGLDSYENPEPDDFNPFVEGEDDPDDEEEEWWATPGEGVQVASAAGGEEVPEPGPKSAVPTDEGDQEEGSSLVEDIMNTTGGPARGPYFAAIDRLIERFPRTAAFRRSGDAIVIADSSVDPSSLPGGPRILHVGPAESPEELGGYSDDQFSAVDAPGYDGFQGNDPVYEGQDANMDGVTGYGDPTDGDSTTFKASSVASMAERLASNTYSWLPGSRNEKLMPYDDLGASADAVAWMAANDSPEPPAGMVPRPVKPPEDPLWEAVRSNRAERSTY